MSLLYSQKQQFEFQENPVHYFLGEAVKPLSRRWQRFFFVLERLPQLRAVHVLSQFSDIFAQYFWMILLRSHIAWLRLRCAPIIHYNSHQSSDTEPERQPNVKLIWDPASISKLDQMWSYRNLSGSYRVSILVSFLHKLHCRSVYFWTIGRNCTTFCLQFYTVQILQVSVIISVSIVKTPIWNRNTVSDVHIDTRGNLRREGLTDLLQFLLSTIHIVCTQPRWKSAWMYIRFIIVFCGYVIIYQNWIKA